MNTYRAFKTGIRDGFDSPYEMNVGMSYDSDVRQAAWDYGSLIGQFIGKVVR